MLYMGNSKKNEEQMYDDPLPIHNYNQFYPFLDNERTLAILAY